MKRKVCFYGVLIAIVMVLSNGCGGGGNNAQPAASPYNPAGVPSTPQPAHSSSGTSGGTHISAYDPNNGDYWLSFDWRIFVDESYWLNQTQRVGSCATAGVLTVERLLENQGYANAAVANDAMKNKDYTMNLTDNAIYTPDDPYATNLLVSKDNPNQLFRNLGIQTMMNTLYSDNNYSYQIVYDSTTYNYDNKSFALSKILEYLGNNYFVIALAPYGFDCGSIGHFYIIYAASQKRPDELIHNDHNDKCESELIGGGKVGNYDYCLYLIDTLYKDEDFPDVVDWDRIYKRVSFEKYAYVTTNTNSACAYKYYNRLWFFGVKKK